MTRKAVTTAFWMGRLPHWEVEDGCYFITIHLAGAIPVQGRHRLRDLNGQLRRIAKYDEANRLKLQRAIFREMETWLDHAQCQPHLQNRELANAVVEAIKHREEQKIWQILEYVVMPTHLHLFCSVGDQSLKGILEDFKRWTSHCASKRLDAAGNRFWQREWFDHWSRSDEEDERIAAYIRQNPVKANLVSDYKL